MAAPVADNPDNDPIVNPDGTLSTPPAAPRPSANLQFTIAPGSDNPDNDPIVNPDGTLSAPSAASSVPPANARQDTLTAAAPYGLTDELVRGATLGISDPVAALGRASGSWLAGRGFDYSQQMRQIEAGRQAYEAANPYSALGANVLGGMATGLPPGGGVVGGALTGAGAGAVSGAAENATSPRAALTGALSGAGTGALVGGGGGFLGNLVSPTVAGNLQTLLAGDVAPTVGQIARASGGTLGAALGRAEEMVSSIPLVGDFIKSGQRGALLDFNRGAINRALTPIGETLEAEPGTREAIAEMQQKVTDYYDKLTSGLGFSAGSPASAQFANDLAPIRQMAAFMPPDRAAQLNNILDSQIFSKMSPGGGMTGQSFQEAKSAIGQLASNYRNSSSADERQLGDALLQSQLALRNAMRTGNPQIATQLDNADQAYANMLRVQRAASASGGAEPGLFTPAQLQAAARALDPTLRHRAFAGGGALMQDYAEAGKNVLGNRLPESGTAPRGMMGLLAAALLEGGAAEHGLVSPHTLIGTGLGVGGAAAAYSPIGRRALAAALTQRPAIAAPLATALRGTVPGSTVYASGLLAPQQQ